MPHYYFHVHNSIGFVEDEEGRDLPDRDVARQEAIKGIRSILSEDVLGGFIDLAGRIEVVEEGSGDPALTVPFDEAVDVRT
ncbi:MAG: hypothetical protein E6G92_11155 [Alphaproteobacteria bacterium]|nr:MAG: hypothetical protein E6G92_11155 [Alphaproteobacteria bacterium]